MHMQTQLFAYARSLMRTRTQFLPGTRTQFLMHAVFMRTSSSTSCPQPELAVFRGRICARKSCPAFFRHHFANAHTDAGERKRTHTHANPCTRIQTLAHGRNTYTHERFGCFARPKTHADVNCVLSGGDFRVRTQNVGSKTFRMYYTMTHTLTLEHTNLYYLVGVTTSAKTP